jgi:hypothetical protein
MDPSLFSSWPISELHVVIIVGNFRSLYEIQEIQDRRVIKEGLFEGKKETAM